MSAGVRCWVEISTGQIAANLRSIRAVVGPGVEVVPVVKADAYNHGAATVSSVLVADGARWLAVASVEEGIALRTAGVETPIVVMADFLPAEWDDLLDHRLTPVFHAIEDLSGFSRLLAPSGRTLPIHLKFDSGLGRLGTREEIGRIVQALQAAPNLRLEGLMTHLASPENFLSSQTEDQLDRFSALYKAIRAAGLHPPYVHLSSTSAIAYGRRQAWQTMVRPGLGIYGYIPRASGNPRECLFPVKPALQWKAVVLRVKDVAAGEFVGYSATFRAARASQIAVVAAGYADGYPHRLGNCGKVIVNGVLAPLAGVVSMDLLTVDVTDCPPVSVGQTVTLLGREGSVSMDAQDLADAAGTIAYAILCGIGKRVRRVYV